MKNKKMSQSGLDRKEFKEEKLNSNNKKEGEMNKRDKNLLSLVIGIILIIIGLSGSAITLPTRSQIVIVPIISLIVGAILAILGGLERW